MIRRLSRRTILGGALATAAGPAFADEDAGLVRVALKTSKGVITLDINVGKAPITGRNFLKYVDTRRYDGSSFYRVSHVKGAPDFGIVEGGLKGNPAKILPPIRHESTAQTGLTHKDGTLSMARRAPGTATADFFICVGDQPGFDADPNAAGDKNGFAAFGQVVDGMDVVHTIFGLPTSPTAGPAVMRGEMLSPPVPILTARRTA
jgi:peptidyl-prolyl cis-trans isomerase A (cyclophilin A)